MHSFFVRPGTASAIRSHLSGVLAGYVRRAFSKSWKRKKKKQPLPLFETQVRIELSRKIDLSEFKAIALIREVSKIDPY